MREKVIKINKYHRNVSTAVPLYFKKIYLKKYSSITQNTPKLWDWFQL